MYTFKLYFHSTEDNYDESYVYVRNYGLTISVVSKVQGYFQLFQEANINMIILKEGSYKQLYLFSCSYE